MDDDPARVLGVVLCDLRAGELALLLRGTHGGRWEEENGERDEEKVALQQRIEGGRAEERSGCGRRHGEASRIYGIYMGVVSRSQVE